MKQIIYTISLMLLLGACTDENYTGMPSGGSESSAPVPVKLALNIQPVQSPLSSGTKADGSHVVSSTQVCKGVEISLVETPMTRAIVEDEIENFCVFQFNGTVPASTLVKKQWVSSDAVKDVVLIASGSNKNRIVVIANASEGTFGSITEGTRLDVLNELAISHGSDQFPANYPLFNASPDPRVVFAGSTDMIVAPNKQADIMLYRTVAKVNIKLTLSQKMSEEGYESWSYQFMRIPKKSFYHSIGHTAVYPTADVGYAAYKSKEGVTFPLDINTFLPVNLQHPVPFTTPEKRGTNAPAGATYLQIMGIKMESGTISKSVLYQIHLGRNFTDDYSISPNFSYAYNIKITGESDDDSRVVKFIPGYFSGVLKGYDVDGNEVAPSSAQAVTWRYQKRIEVSMTDVGTGGPWLGGGAGMPSANSFIDGLKNTQDLFDDRGNYPVVRKCIELNSEPVDKNNLLWYTPSFGQTLGIYVAGSNTLKSLPNATYWTSSTDGVNAWGMKVWSGKNTQEAPGMYLLRCIKNLESPNVIP